MLARLETEEDDTEAEQLQFDEPAEEELSLVPAAPDSSENVAGADGDQEPQSSFPFQQ
jgi:hypothetical protein